MDPEQMFNRAPHSPIRSTGWLHGWRLAFAGENLTWDGALVSVVEDNDDPDAKVFVVLYDMTEEDEKSLDSWEGTELGIYRKIKAGIETLEGEHRVAWLYVVDAFEGGLPSARYLSCIVEAARKAGAPDDYIARLLKLESINVGPGPAR